MYKFLKHFVIFLLLTIITIQFVTPPKISASGSSWLTGWNFRKKITISHINVSASDLADFPLLVKVSADSDMSVALSNGYDIRFTDSTGSTILSYERESWSGGGGSAATAVFWVKIPMIYTSNDTNIYLYYGNSEALDGQNTTNVWNSNYKAVWHLGTPSVLSMTDSTGNNICTNHGATAGTGQIGGAVTFDGSHYIDCGNDNSLVFTTGFSAEMWVDPDFATGGWYSLFGKDRFGGGRGWLAYLFNGQVNYQEPSSDEYIAQSTDTFPADTWTYLSIINDGENASIYLNGTKNGSSTYVPIVDEPVSLLLGARQPNTGDVGAHDFFPGVLDEIRFSSINRPNNWIKFEYCNMMTLSSGTCSGNNELSFTDQETVPITSLNSSSLSPVMPGPSVCNDSEPLGIPDLFQIIAGGSSAKVFFTPLMGTNQYYISFSTKPIAEEHGVLVTLTCEGVQNFTVNFLKPNTTYYFKVRGQNGCMPGSWSNVMKIKANSKGSINNVFYYKYGYSKYNSATKLSNIKNNTEQIKMISPQPTTSPVVNTDARNKRCFLFWCH